MTHSFTIREKLPSMNDYVSACRANAKAGAKMKRYTQEAIGLYIMAAKLPKPVKTPVTIRFGWIEPDRRRDKDNIAAAKKFILDALVVSGVLPDDGWAHVEGFSDEFHLMPGKAGVVVEIEEVEM